MLFHEPAFLSSDRLNRRLPATGDAAGAAPSFLESRVGALAFTFQIYSDFSACRAMAIGLSRMFGIWVPVKFASPYKATSIIEFSRAAQPAEQGDGVPAVPDLRSVAWCELASSRVQFHVPISNPGGLKLARVYRETIAKLRGDGVAPCLVTHRVSSAYRDVAKRYRSFAAAQGFYDQVAIESGAKRVDYWAKIGDDAFGDTDPLRATAAPAYTQRLLRDCFAGS